MAGAGLKAAVAEAVLRLARWDVDQVVTNSFGERVWLGPCFDGAGRRTGITDCCFVERPCARHAAIAARP